MTGRASALFLCLIRTSLSRIAASTTILQRPGLKKHLEATGAMLLEPTRSKWIKSAVDLVAH